mgnify:CR=1 FL=1
MCSLPPGALGSVEGRRQDLHGDLVPVPGAPATPPGLVHPHRRGQQEVFGEAVGVRVQLGQGEGRHLAGRAAQEPRQRRVGGHHGARGGVHHRQGGGVVQEQPAGGSGKDPLRIAVGGHGAVEGWRWAAGQVGGGMTKLTGPATDPADGGRGPTRGRGLHLRRRWGYPGVLRIPRSVSRPPRDGSPPSPPARELHAGTTPRR